MSEFSITLLLFPLMTNVILSRAKVFNKLLFQPFPLLPLFVVSADGNKNLGNSFFLLITLDVTNELNLLISE